LPLNSQIRVPGSSAPAASTVDSATDLPAPAHDLLRDARSGRARTRSLGRAVVRRTVVVGHAVLARTREETKAVMERLVANPEQRHD
jgi:hypothetical protein